MDVHGQVQRQISSENCCQSVPSQSGTEDLPATERMTAAATTGRSIHQAGDGAGRVWRAGNFTRARGTKPKTAICSPRRARRYTRADSVFSKLGNIPSEFKELLEMCFCQNNKNTKWI